MPTLRCATTVLTIIGCRRPSSWTSGPVKFLYKAYGIVVLILVQMLTSLSILDVIFNVQNQDEFSDNLVLTLPMLITCCKFCNFLTRGTSIMHLIDTLQREPYLPDNNDEMNVETKHDRHNEYKYCPGCRKISTVYVFMSEACIVMILLTTLITNGKNRILPYRLWIPFDYSAPAVYAAIFFFQATSVIVASLMNVTYDALFSGLMFCIHSQLEILGLRLQNVIKTGKVSARECARHHNFLYEFSAKVNEDFQTVLCFQFMASIATICFTLYRITQTDLGERLASTLVYALCMLLQIFYYCWYGNEVKRKSLEVPDCIFASNWAGLDDDTKKTLLMIMIRATFPIEFTTAHILSVNIESFMAVSMFHCTLIIIRRYDQVESVRLFQVLKTSYSVYNVLQVKIRRLTKSTMPTLRCATTVLTMIGCHRPSSWKSWPLKLLYKTYGIAVLILVETLTLAAVLDVVFNVQNQDEFSDNLVLTIPMLITCCKFCSFLTHGNNIMVLINTLQQKPYLPDNTDEMKIEKKYDRHNEKITSVYISLCEVCIVMILSTALITNGVGAGKKLGFRLWIPFDYSAPTVYAVIFFLQAVSVFIAALMNLTYDALFSGLMFCIYSQLEILGLRLQSIVKNGKESATECARHHNFLYEFAAKVNEEFQIVVCIQFMASMMIICFTLYRITQTDLGERLASTLLYALCMLMQIFYYCWYGNEVKRKVHCRCKKPQLPGFVTFSRDHPFQSLEVPDWIFASNWASLDDNTKKTLLMIMMRATFPIKFSTARIVSVNIDSFMSVSRRSIVLPHTSIDRTLSTLIMTALKYTFSFLTLLGCLRPFTWTSRAKRWLYKAYSLVILLFVQYMMVIAVLDIIFNVENQDQFCDNFSITVAVLISIYKMLNFRGRRESILLLINSLEKEPFMPMNKAEMEIKLKFDRAIQKNTIVFMVVVQCYLLVTWMSSLMRDLKLRKLAHQRVWVPYDYSSLILYIVTYSHQASSLILLTVMHLANDTLISGLMVLTCCQLELLQHRLQNITGDHSQSVKACARHHECIYQCVLDSFIVLIFLFIILIFSNCLQVRIESEQTVSRYPGLSVHGEYSHGVPDPFPDLDNEYGFATVRGCHVHSLYHDAAVLLLLSLEVPDMIFTSDWPNLDTNAKKMLLFIMQRSTFPIEFTSAHIFAVNLDSFMAVLKTSYSIFNLLQSR
ncbi:uncharacterized protein LOC144467574 [Augochlora pura]